ncbi:hypothetical protein TNCV_1992781 [Trichonephila clavipes]|nr:hypothetical protein TNCV_1992781 [Trichonephila clavipes]
MYLYRLSLYIIRRGRLPGHDGRCRVGYVQWTTPPPVLRVEQSTLTSHPVGNVRLKDTRENTQMDVRDAKAWELRHPFSVGVRGTPRNSSACKQQQGRYTNYCCNPYGKAAPITPPLSPD